VEIKTIKKIEKRQRQGKRKEKARPNKETGLEKKPFEKKGRREEKKA